MTAEQKRLRVLYSFPHKIGAGRICYTAWQQVNGLAAAGADVLVFPGVLHKELPANVKVVPTLALGKLRISYKAVGATRACALHDYVVSRRLKQLVGQIDIIHTWPSGAERTLEMAAKLGIPTVLERPNAHTRFAYEVVQKECRRLGITLPPNYEHTYRADVLKKEEKEFRLAYRLLCPSDFVVRTFLEQGFGQDRLVRHIYGFDEGRFYPDSKPEEQEKGLTMISVGLNAVRKGLHYALEAWLSSPARHDGTFLIAGGFLPAYHENLAAMLSHPSVKVLGHRDDVPELMRKSDIMVLPSIEEGFGLVCVEAMGSGCVPLVSEACTDACRHMENGLVHPVGDVTTLTSHITLLHENRALLTRLRDAALHTAPEYTWYAAGARLLQVYRGIIAGSL
ncbi:MAG: glycosyltransferase family 4 protein [Syntrophorhabdales bacterium]